MLFCLNLPLFIVSTLCSHSLASVLKRHLLPPPLDDLDLELIFAIIFKSVGTFEEISHFLQIIHSPVPPSQCCDPPSIKYYALGC